MQYVINPPAISRTVSSAEFYCFNYVIIHFSISTKTLVIPSSEKSSESNLVSPFRHKRYAINTLNFCAFLCERRNYRKYRCKPWKFSKTENRTHGSPHNSVIFQLWKCPGSFLLEVLQAMRWDHYYIVYAFEHYGVSMLCRKNRKKSAIATSEF